MVNKVAALQNFFDKDAIIILNTDWLWMSYWRKKVKLLIAKFSLFKKYRSSNFSKLREMHACFAVTFVNINSLCHKH